MTHGCITSPARNRLHSRCGRTSCRIPASSHVLCAVWEQVGHPSGAPNTTCGSITRNAQASKHSPRTCPMNALVAVVSRAYALSTAALSRRLRLVTVCSKRLIVSATWVTCSVLVVAVWLLPLPDAGVSFEKTFQACAFRLEGRLFSSNVRSSMLHGTET